MGSGDELFTDATKYEIAEIDGSKKEYQVHIKEYLKAVKKQLDEDRPDDVDQFMKDAQVAVKEFILPNFKDLEFFVGPAMADPAMIVLVLWADCPKTGENLPYLYFFKDGLKDEKV